MSPVYGGRTTRWVARTPVRWGASGTLAAGCGRAVNTAALREDAGYRRCTVRLRGGRRNRVAARPRGRGPRVAHRRDRRPAGAVAARGADAAAVRRGDPG